MLEIKRYAKTEATKKLRDDIVSVTDNSMTLKKTNFFNYSFIPTLYFVNNYVDSIILDPHIQMAIDYYANIKKYRNFMLINAELFLYLKEYLDETYGKPAIEAANGFYVEYHLGKYKIIMDEHLYGSDFVIKIVF